ncbi:Uma2 family endonuclease [Leptolyngbya sp. CCNP1308]|uniref:Uma2 family endonuclease n=1 Tax=Leptolyngbya sp. CCNP1308 TaxID=3110255 RepID=UPI002B1FE0AD|nr:Uma2 family endonuclease [Leptolyngbya sp. CCNP1308]MEA5447643.1 Uma2 family endonuclease [Leptolyngbya sp. CCNP1308]
MAQSPIITSPLEAFLNQDNIDGSPAWEFIHGQAQQKPMPTLYHSRLQRNLVNAINAQTTVYEAIQELRCIVPPLSPVPDIVIVVSDRLPETDGPLQGAPDWLVEIRSSNQSTLELQAKILHCLANGTQLAWLIDIQRQQIWVWQGAELPIICAGLDPLPTLGTLEGFTVDAVMALSQQR